MMEWVKLGDVCEIIMGQSPDSSSYNYDGMGLPFFQGNADFGDLYPNTRVYCDQPNKTANKNDVLISVRAPIGAVNIATESCCIGRGLAAIRVIKRVTQHKFLFYFLKSKNRWLNLQGTGSTFKAINKKVLSNLAMILPPLLDQIRIAETLDKVKGIIDARKKQIEKLDEYIKSVFYTMFGDPIANSMDWKLKKLVEIGYLASGGTPPRSQKEYFMGDINWYSAGELNQIYLPDSNEKITETAIKKTSAKLFNKGSLLIGMYDTAAFKLGILTQKSSSNQACANIDVDKNNVCVEWLYYNLAIMRPYFLNNRRGIRQKNLNLGMIKEFKIPLPPLLLQKQFAEIVEKTEAQKELLNKSLSKMETLFDCLMDQYFS